MSAKKYDIVSYSCVWIKKTNFMNRFFFVDDVQARDMVFGEDIVYSVEFEAYD